MAKARVLYLISSFAQGGAERHLIELLRALDPTRYDTAVVALRDTIHYAGEIPADEPRYPLHRKTWFAAGVLPAIRRALRDFRPDILHCYLNDGNLWGRIAVRSLPRNERPRVLTSVHLDEMAAGYRWLERPLSALSDVVIAHSRSIADLLIGRLRLPAAKVRVLVNGVDCRKFVPTGNAAEVRQARHALGLPTDGHVALMAARIAPQKNQRLVVAALAAARAKGRLPSSFRLVLAGRVSNTVYARVLATDIARLGLERVVLRLGAVVDMPPLYRAVDTVWLPSRTEASPIAALEASACARPVLISDAANTDGVVIPEATGWQVPVNERDALAEQVERILVLPQSDVERIGRAGRRHVEESFTNASVATRMAALYDELRPSPA